MRAADTNDSMGRTPLRWLPLHDQRVGEQADAGTNSVDCEAARTGPGATGRSRFARRSADGTPGQAS